jgi:hypothetical protein
MECKGATAYPLLGYHVLENPQQPTIAAIAFHTEGGDQHFAATREILEDLATAFLKHAAKIPRKRDQH